MRIHTLAFVFASISIVGCGSAPEEAKAKTSSADSSQGTEFVSVPQGPGYVPYLRSFPSYYWNQTFANACGGNYDIDMTVEFGEVTATSMQVNAVLVYYHASPDVTIVPTTMDVYSKEGTDVRKSDELILARHDGDSHRYQINKTFPVDANHALIVEFHTSAGLPSGDSSDFACGQDAEIAYVPGS